MRAVLIVLLIAAGPAWACGYCVEDKVAAAYDHAVVKRAVAQKHHVAFFQIDGTASSRKTLEDAVYLARGVDRGSVRVAGDGLTISFAFDPARASLGTIHSGIEKRLRGVSLMPLQVMEQAGDLKTVGR